MFTVLTVLSVVLTAAGAAKAKHASSPSRRRLRSARRGIRRLKKRQGKLRRFFNRLRGRIQRVSKPMRVQQLEQQMRVTPLHALKSGISGSVRWSALEENGIESLADLEATPLGSLVDIDGVGQKSADRVREAAAQHRARAAEEPLLAPGADLNEPAAAAVAREGVRLADAQRAAGPVLAQLDAKIEDLEQKHAGAKRASGFWRWLFRPKSRPVAVDAAAEVDDLAQAHVTELDAPAQAALGDAAKASKRRRPASEVASEYASRLAECASVIEQATTTSAAAAPGHATASDNALDAETQQAIERTRLSAHVMSIALRGYQQFGSKFILNQKRTLLGDEMGLGKTVQTLAAMSQLWVEAGKAHFVVVAPASLLLNWKSEITDKTRLTSFIAHGSQRQSQESAWIAHGGVLIVSYATLRSSPIDEENLPPLAMLVADEAHYIKNPDSGRTQAVVDLLAGAERVCFLTGTPMENHPREFEQLISMLRPSLSGQLSQLGLSEVDLNEPDGPDLSARFRAAVAPVYLRRNQRDVLKELPELIEVNEWVSPTAGELRRYAAAVAEGAIMTMRRVVTAPEGKERSSKLERLQELLETHREEGRKTIVFSFFLDVLDAAAERCPHVGVIRGGQSPQQRQEILDEFSDTEGPAVLLAQIVAAGQGLNLQAASAIVLLEPQFTPSLEAQAIARAHRMGQTRRVVAHRVLAADTIDERLTELLQTKRTLFDDYARHSLTSDTNPEATETELVKVLIEQERARLNASGVLGEHGTV